MTSERDKRLALLPEILRGRIGLMDGAMGTMIQALELGEADFRGERFADHGHDLKGNNDLLVLTKPDAIADIYRGYFEAGVDIIQTNTFNSTEISQSDYGLEGIVPELNKAGARLAREIADDFEKNDPERPRYVAGILGPTNRTASISPDVNDPGFRNVSFDRLRDDYRQAACP